MADQWYYWQDAEVLGPFSGRRLVNMAAEGKILPTDIVWREGTEQGVAASQVKHLFAAAPLAQPSPPPPQPRVPHLLRTYAADATVARMQPAGVSDVVKEMPSVLVLRGGHDADDSPRHRGPGHDARRPGRHDREVSDEVHDLRPRG